MPRKDAGRYVAEEVREFKREARGRKVGTRRTTSREQAIAIGLSRARAAGLDVPPPPRSRVVASMMRKK